MEGMLTSALCRAFCMDGFASGRFKQASRETYLSDLRILVTFCGTDDVRTLTAQRCAGYPAWLGQRVVPKREGTTGHAPAGIRRRVYVASAFCEWLVERGDLAVNPFSRVRVPKRPRTLPRAVPVDHVKACLAHPETTVRDSAIIALMRYEGLRVGEVERVTVEDLDADLTTLRVWGKGDKERVVPIFDEFLPYLKDWMGVREWKPGPLFRGEKGPCTRKVVGRVLARVARAAGVTPFTAHKLRHTCGKDLIQRGVPANIVQAILGHESLATTSIYTQATGADVMSAKAIMARMVTVQQGKARQGGGDSKPTVFSIVTEGVL